MTWVVGIGIFVFLMFAYPKKTLILAGVLLAFAVAGGGIIFLSDYLDQRKREAVQIEIFFDLDKCSEEYPLFIGFLNESGSTIEKVSFIVEGKREGYSDTTYRSEYGNYQTDKIIKDGGSHGTCWRVPPLVFGAPESDKGRFPAKDMVWSVTSVYPRFAD
ncbi:hypothetical protein ACP90_18950 [Labrenzia sp. CP4]|jgi:hypothetical protein|uniref:hypothetical protein n=1 Tax=Labrenzia sp. CP4 TaxID=1674922 RepID=UPI000781926A|nr:hypothetical protein [Labrenzia sp. CP4]AMN54158.1 hypothetical protein ACP90_18950 [Labrenzia sp. CP4]